MRNVPQQMTDAWLSGDYTGPQRAMQRATIQVINLKERRVDSVDEVYAMAVFGQTQTPVELPNVKSISWQRSVDSDAASCTLVLYNTEPLPLGQVPDLDGNLDLPGYYTFNRGRTNYLPASTRWGHTANAWQDMLVPDRLIKTYEGYGFDSTVGPDLDPHMVQSGVWLIDDVRYGTDGLITVECRDLGRLLLDQIMFPPVVPMQQYPLQFETRHEVTSTSVSTASGFTSGTLSNDSNAAGGYTGFNGSVYGHQPSHALDTDPSTYWLSIGNATPNSDYSFEWLEINVSGAVSAVKVHTWGGPYRMYVSVYADGAWQGQAKVPYNPKSQAAAPNGSDIPYLAVATVDKDAENVVRFSTVQGVTKVRVTFTSLYDSNLGTYQYRAGVRTFQVSAEVQTTTTTTSICGNIDDYTDIVKKLLAYGGFWWSAVAAENNIEITDGSEITITPVAGSDPVLGEGRIWGDVMMSGTAPIAPTPENPDLVSVPLGVEIWDKKPLMDGINYVRDVLGFIFFVDELGAAVFRFPNMKEVGNYIGAMSSGSGPAYSAGTVEMVIIDEQQTLISLTARLSSRSMRERVFVANSSGAVGAMAAGHNPYPANLRRVGGWTDLHFTDSNECKVMAELITLQQVFTYRTDQVEIPGYSRIQIDDQVRLIEAITSETNVHYIKAITSEWDLETGRWTYQLDTQWLGGAPDDDWVFHQEDLSAETQTYLNGLWRE